jgi:hypothetical protein
MILSGDAVRRCVDGMICPRCSGLGWVCENHLDRPWAEPGKYSNSCDCGAGASCPRCNPLHRDHARPETVDDLVASIIAERERLRDHDPDASPGQFWTAALNAFAADVVNRVLPDDPVAQAAVIRKAQAFGVDIG